MLVKLKDGCYDPHKINMEINNLRNAKERLRELIEKKKKEQDKYDKEQMRAYSTKLEKEEENEKNCHGEGTDLTSRFSRRVRMLLLLLMGDSRPFVLFPGQTGSPYPVGTIKEHKEADTDLIPLLVR
ncbi:hypothetical protein CHS0354_028324 [Potamilus streckersoni]|uniref:Uncharacterized protein n=1 Tax=Potamilus streckersoni TaxID=2493646 RepID=A0AAE0RTQ9_9BIVA|nr:hypothetical protein CHS0354_028324 [Potamilus streckersoni]